MLRRERAGPASLAAAGGIRRHPRAPRSGRHDGRRVPRNAPPVVPAGGPRPRAAGGAALARAPPARRGWGAGVLDTLGGVAIAQIYPSLLAADFARIADAALVVEGRADWLHVDVMDNHFVPNLAFSGDTVTALRQVTDIPLDCHLMIEDPDRWAPGFAERGAANVTIHAEAVDDLPATTAAIRAEGARTGLAVKPATP